MRKLNRSAKMLFNIFGALVSVSVGGMGYQAVRTIHARQVVYPIAQNSLVYDAHNQAVTSGR